METKGKRRGEFWTTITNTVAFCSRPLRNVFCGAGGRWHWIEEGILGITPEWADDSGQYLSSSRSTCLVWVSLCLNVTLMLRLRRKPLRKHKTQHNASSVLLRSATQLPCSYFMVLIGAITYAGRLFFFGGGWGGGGAYGCNITVREIRQSFPKQCSHQLEGRLDDRGKGKNIFFFF